MTLLYQLSINTMWQVSPVTIPQAPDMRWVVEVNDPIGGRGARLAVVFKTKSGAEAVAKAMNKGQTPHELGFSVIHLLDR